ncbi:glutamate-cysteine ligase family protein [Streptomyces sp. NPDC003781]|uniref:glutamate-cysteine ligase family protein n=1 Tax=Streptomyces sp. NPDC003781 TaxID=3364686 RepID=UPI0036BA1164
MAGGYPDTRRTAGAPSMCRFRPRAVLAAAFADQPMAESRATGWLSTRRQMWAGLGPGRAGGPLLSHDPRRAWVRRVLDAPLMCIRRDGPWEAPDRVTFRQ